MAFKFFQVPIRDSLAAEAALNECLGSHRVLAVDRRWVDQGPDSFWSLCIDYMQSGSAATSERVKKGKDYKQTLSP